MQSSAPLKASTPTRSVGQTTLRERGGAIPPVSGVGGGASLALWQRQAVMAAASLLRERFLNTPDDQRARTLHAALLEVVEPTRRAARLEHELQSDVAATTIALRAERRARGRRSGGDRRLWEFGPPRGRERRRCERRDAERRERR